MRKFQICVPLHKTHIYEEEGLMHPIISYAGGTQNSKFAAEPHFATAYITSL